MILSNLQSDGQHKLRIYTQVPNENSSKVMARDALCTALNSEISSSRRASSCNVTHNRLDTGKSTDLK